MSEIMTPIPFNKLIRWMLEEYRTKNSVFGVKKERFYRNRSDKKYRIFGTDLGSPIGAAAGPNTQLAQNLAAGYVSGLRFMELKTVQIMDGEEMRKCIARPCISVPDEGYNVEWSTELTVQEAFCEYVKGWFALHVAAREFSISAEPDFLFNMSVGYTYEGVTSKKIDGFISDMADARDTDVFKECKEYLLANLDLFEHIDAAYVNNISSRISGSITLSTLHGCPPAEIERIAKHFLAVKKLNTYIKCNPTLLGYDFVRNLLNEMGYGYVSFDHRHFDADLKFADAAVLIERLRNIAQEQGLEFGVKLTNTFPVQIRSGELPGEFMYMSGRALFPLSINVAKKLSQAFKGKLPVSFSGGADYFNVDKLIRVGIAPVTVATTILKPGGYARARQLSEKVEGLAEGAFCGINLPALEELADNIAADKHLVKWAREAKSRKIKSSLPVFDCFTAPCSSGGCPINQQIPEYLALVAAGEYDKAFRVIATDNPLPAITSEICNHACQSKCTRLDYDEPLRIRSAKNTAVKNAQRKYIDQIIQPPLRTEKKVAIIGAGPAGVAAALYLRRNGVGVTVFEKRDKPMGVVQYIIPEFRISAETIGMDYELALKTGVEFRFGVPANYDIQELKKSYDFIVIATGAWAPGACPCEGEDKLLDALAFLEDSKTCGCRLHLGKRVAVIGGGDVAMDCARAAKRCPGVEQVSILYRRTREFMPAEREEQELALADGIAFRELLSPVSCDGKMLTVECMELGEPEPDGRRKFVCTGKKEELPFDTVISAVGARVDTKDFARNGIKLANGYAVLDQNNQTSIEGVYVSGDCRAGAATIVQAAGDSKRIAVDILDRLGLANDFERTAGSPDSKVLAFRKSILCGTGAGTNDPMRCLACGNVCEICCEVCPNRANISVAVEGRPQILHLDTLCNECGNCGVFCPHTGNPYKDKVTLFADREAFADSTNKGFALLGDELLVRDEQGEEFICKAGDKRLSPEFAAMVRAVMDEHKYLL